MTGTVTVVGGGVAGLTAACALADAGFKVTVLERRPRLGGRATSQLHPGVGEVIDNCQHVLFGCCDHLRAFYRRIGAEARIRWSREFVLVEPGGRQSVLRPSILPAPYHALPSFLAAPAFSLRDKFALARGLRALLGPIPDDSAETFGAWLVRHGQPPSAVRRFWRPVITSALNAEPDAVALGYAAKVARELFLHSADAGAMGLSTVPLAELYDAAVDFLRDRHSAVRLNVRVESAQWDGTAGRWTLGTSGGDVDSQFVVFAASFDDLARLMPRLPHGEGADRLAGQLGRLLPEPICSVHLWFDREITDLEHAALLDREIQWLYNKSRIQPSRSGGPGSYLELVVSAARGFAQLPAEDAIARAVAELGEFFPAARTARLEKSALVKELRATFSVPPGVDANRPTAAAPWPHCFLAGDWTATGWPSTMESAARSGDAAAEALCRLRISAAADSVPHGSE